MVEPGAEYVFLELCIPDSAYAALRSMADDRHCSISRIVTLLVVDELSRDYLSGSEVRNG